MLGIMLGKKNYIKNLTDQKKERRNAAMEVKSSIINVSENEAAVCADAVLESSTFAKGDSWAHCK